MCDKLQHRAVRLSKNLAITYWEFARHWRIAKRNLFIKEYYLLRKVIFEIKRVQFSITVKRLVIHKTTVIHFGSCPSIAIDFPTMPP